MRRILARIEDRARRFDDAPLFRFIDDSKLAPRDRLGYAPCIAHFVMTFADLYALVFRQEPPEDELQELVNAHTYEDGNHYRWFLRDLAALGWDAALPLSEALAFVWGEHCVRTRVLSYGMCRLAARAGSLERLVLVQCIEAAGKVSLQHVARAARDYTASTGTRLLYFGNLHLETEAQHTLEQPEASALLERVELDPAALAELSTLVDEAFSLFDGFAADLLGFASSASKRSSSGLAGF